MALQILGLSPAEQYKQNIGQELGTGLGAGLQQLANAKMKQLQQQKLAQGLGGLDGFSPEQAQALSNLPPDILKEVVKAKTGGSVQRQQQQMEAQRTKLEPKWNYLEERSDILDRINDILDDPDLSLGGTISALSGLPTQIGRPLMEQISPKSAELDALSHRLVTLDDEARGKGMRGKFITEQRQKSKIGLANSLKNNKALLKDFMNSTQKEKESFRSNHPWYFNTQEQPSSSKNLVNIQGKQYHLIDETEEKVVVQDPETGQKFKIDLTQKQGM